MKLTYKFLAFPLLAVAISSAQANLVTNGSFEEGASFNGGFLEVPAGGSSITSWTVGGGGVDYIGSYWDAQDQDRSIDLNRLTFGSLFQDIATTAGTKYEISFWMSGNPDINAPSVPTYALRATLIDVVNGGSTILTTQDASYTNGSHSHGNMMWTKFTFDFTATSALTRLNFEGIAPPGAYGAALDNVSMTEVVPEPFTMMLMGGAAVGAFAKVRRRRSAKLS